MKSFFKSHHASTAVEFAFILPVLLLLLIGIIEFGFTMFYDSSLNLGVRTVGRQGVAQGYDDFSQIQAIMNANLGGIYDTDVNDTTFIIRTYNNFKDMQTDATLFASSPASFFPPAGTTPTVPPKTCTNAIPALNECQSGQIVLYGVKYKWGGLTGILKPFLPDYLYSFSVVRNESFD